jgi:peroxiredoxin
MKTSRISFLTVFFAFTFVVFSACTPKPAQAQTASTAPSTEGVATQADASSLALADPASPALDTNLAALEKLGFHIFPKPVALPEFSVPSLSGTTLKSTDLTGTVTVMNFWATWCPPCNREMPSIQRLFDQMKGTAFRIVAISTGEAKQTVTDFLKKNSYNYPMFLDENRSLGAAFASQGIPTTYILDKSGKIVAGIVGSREYDEPALVAVLKDMASK